MREYQREAENEDALPEADLFDAMFLPDLKSVILESFEERWHTAGDGGVDSEFVDHFDAQLRFSLE